MQNKLLSLWVICFAELLVPVAYANDRSTGEVECIHLARPFADTDAADSARGRLLPDELEGAGISELIAWSANSLTSRANSRSTILSFSQAMSDDAALAITALRELLGGKDLDVPTRMALLQRASSLSKTTGDSDFAVFVAIKNAEFERAFRCSECGALPIETEVDIERMTLSASTADAMIYAKLVASGESGRKALDKGCLDGLPSAPLELFLRLHDRSTSIRDQAAELKSLLLLAESRGSIDATYWLAIAEQPDPDRVMKFPQAAIERLASAAGRGHAEAQYRLTTILMSGESVSSADLENTAILLKKSADNGYSDSAYRSYLLYQTSSPPFRDLDKAMYWLNRAVAFDAEIPLKVLKEFHLDGN